MEHTYFFFKTLAREIEPLRLRSYAVEKPNLYRRQYFLCRIILIFTNIVLTCMNLVSS